MGEAKQPNIGRQGGQNEATAHAKRANVHHAVDAPAIGDPPKVNTADTKGQHRDGVGQRGLSARDVKLVLYDGEYDR